MATYYFRNTGSTDWGTASNWSLTDGGGATGAIPLSTDDAFFTINSGSATITTTNKVCRNLITTGFAGSITCTTTLTVAGTTTQAARNAEVENNINESE